MSIPRNVRFHFVYQFILLTFIVCATTCYMSRSDKQFLFLFLIPVFSYQMLIILCCTELIPLPCLLSPPNAEVEINEQLTPRVPGALGISSREEEKSFEKCAMSPSGVPKARLCTNFKDSADSAASSDATTQTAYQTVSDIFKKAPASTTAGPRRSESTKSYVYKYGEKRIGDDLESKENILPYKIRSWQSLKDTKPQVNLKSPSYALEETNKVKSPVQLETLDESMESGDLIRSLSFPFRERKQFKFIELADDLANEFQIKPIFNAEDYLGPLNSRKRRKSVSTEAIDRELKLVNYHYEQNEKKDFTRSMEAPQEPIAESATPKKILKPSASFNKWRKGVAKAFIKKI